MRGRLPLDAVRRTRQVRQLALFPPRIGCRRRAVAGLERRGLDYLLLIFHPHLPRTSRLDENDWRDAWLRNLLDELDVPYIWTKDLFRRDASTEPLAFERYILPDNGHPTTYFNELIAAEIKRHVLQGPIRVHPGLTD